MGSTGWLVAGLWGHASDTFRVGLEVDAHQSLVGGPRGPNRAGTLTVFAQNQVSTGLALGLLGGTGYLRGVGAPEYRLGATLSWSAAGARSTPTAVTELDDGCRPGELCLGVDTDGDGFADDRDACPEQAEDIDAFEDGDGCPDLDNDGDGLADTEDTCPLVAGPSSLLGCPDQDADGVPDPRDLCPAMAGPPETEGCPDRDRDQVPDIRDACPDRPAPRPIIGVSSDGCPAGAWVDADQVVLASPVTFTADGAAVSDASATTLDDLARLLVTNPGLTIIEVGGHTDNRGEPESRARLSLERAQAVVTELVERGVVSGRLKARGYADTEPVDTNRTLAGRTRNARIELHILSGTSTSMPATQRPAPRPAGAKGALTITMGVALWGDVYLDGVRLNKGAPFADFPIEAGLHALRVSNPGRRLEWSEQITVTSGETLVVEIPWSVWKPK
jgi:outer membrane protein OmpA-like peptidoglycan-associated protein